MSNTTNDSAAYEKLGAFVAGIVITALLMHALQNRAANMTSASIKEQQAAVTRQLDSVTRAAKSASDSAAAWRSVAQSMSDRADNLSRELDRLGSKRAKIKTEIDNLPDTSLVKRYYLSLYGG